jgi:hypothetical protein
MRKKEMRRISKNSNEKKSFNESEAKNNFYFVCFHLKVERRRREEFLRNRIRIRRMKKKI